MDLAENFKESFLRRLKSYVSVRFAAIFTVTFGGMLYNSYSKHSSTAFLSDELNRVFANEHLPLSSTQDYPFPRVTGINYLSKSEDYQITDASYNTPHTFVLTAKLPEALANKLKGEGKPCEAQFFITASNPSFDITSVSFEKLVSKLQPVQQK